MRSKTSRRAKKLKKLDMRRVKKPSDEEDESPTKHRLTYNDVDLDSNDVALVL